MKKRKPYDVMTNNFRKASLERSVVMAANLSGMLAVVRANNLIFEPIHVRFVGKAGQCKTQYALHVMKMLDECGLIGVNRTATDMFFDDLVKQVKNMVVKRLDDAYVYHSEIDDRGNVDLDVLFLDEVNAKKTVDPGMQTIMDGGTPMRWKPLMANPVYKGKSYKPALWISTANHEITKHEYCIPAVLRRTHYRYVSVVADCTTKSATSWLTPMEHLKEVFKPAKAFSVGGRRKVLPPADPRRSTLTTSRLYHTSRVLLTLWWFELRTLSIWKSSSARTAERFLSRAS